MSKYEKLDAMIMAAIANEPGIKFDDLSNRQPIRICADALADEEKKQPRKGYSEDKGWRVVDRRLKALRKAGNIAYGRGKNAGWRILESGAA